MSFQSVDDVIEYLLKIKEDKLIKTAVFNKVSECCHRPIIFKCGREFPLGGDTWGISTKEPVCESCGKDCGEVDQCEVCGVVGCLGNCTVDISEVEE